VNHRHLDYLPGTPPTSLGSAAVDDLLERGDLSEWRGLLAVIAVDPFGDLSERVLWLCDANPRYGTSTLMRAWIARRRALSVCPSGPPVTLAELRTRRGLTQVELAARVGMRQSDLSKAERRHDWKLSTIARVLDGLGLRGRLVVDDAEDPRGVVGIIPVRNQRD
jgi:hypothetical protein